MTFFRKVTESELDTVYSIYRKATGYPFSVWNEYYPSWDEINDDFAHDDLFVLTENDDIIGNITIVPQNELDDLDCWSITGSESNEISRVVITEKYVGKGYSEMLVRSALEELWQRGCRSVHLMVAKSNIPAFKNYMKIGFAVVGSTFMYGNDYYLCELLSDNYKK